MTKRGSAWLLALGLVSLASIAGAQQVTFPSVVRIVVPFPAGASTDIVARIIAPKLAARLGTTVIVENRAGGSNLIGAAAVAKGPRDGSMILLTSPSMVTVAATMKNMPFDFNADLIPVSIIWEGPMVVAVSTKTNFKTPGDLVAAARAQPDTVTYGTSGMGSLPHLASELINDSAGIRMRHVPYKGSAQAVLDLSAGTIDMMIGSHASFIPQIKAGRVREIAVTSKASSPAFPELAPMGSAAPGFAADSWAAAFVAGGTPAAIVQRLNRELNEIATSKEMLDYMQPEGANAVALTPEQLSQRMRESVATYKKVATAKNIVAE